MSKDRIDTSADMSNLDSFSPSGPPSGSYSTTVPELAERFDVSESRVVEAIKSVDAIYRTGEMVEAHEESDLDDLEAALDSQFG